MTNKEHKLLKSMRSGKVYRREDLRELSNAVDRHLSNLVAFGEVEKLAAGLYYKPKKSKFGLLAPDENELLKAFLKDDDFLVVNPTMYNSLEVGLTQVYNEPFVYNRRRNGRVKVGYRYFNFVRHRNYPNKLSKEFLFVDMVNNLERLGENVYNYFDKVKKKSKDCGANKVLKMAKKYGNVGTRRFFNKALAVNG